MELGSHSLTHPDLRKLDDEALIRAVASRLPAAMTRLAVWRDGVVRDIPIKLPERPLAQPTRASRVRADLRPADEPRGGPLGILVQSLDAAAIRRLGVPAQITGVRNTDPDAHRPAREGRVRPGPNLSEVNWPAAGVMLVGALIGGFAGGKAARVIPDGVLRVLVTAGGLFMAGWYFLR